MSLREGMFTFNENLLKNIKTIPADNEFTLLVTFKPYDIEQSEVCVMSMGRDDKTADLILIHHHNQGYKLALSKGH